MPAWFLLLLAVLLLPLRTAEAQTQPAFDLPISCEMGIVCVVQNYVDYDPGPGAADYTCGLLAYNGHDGTDIRVPNMTYVARGVPVLAAAAGRIAGTRDGVRDVSVRETGKAAVQGIECGNGVLIDHDGGWTTQYCHMRMGSVQVRTGQNVAAGEVLGLVGMSGNAEFPHVHLTVRFNNVAVDPFVGPLPAAACGAPRAPLWSVTAQAKLAYTRAGLLNAGFAAAQPLTTEILAGQHQEPTLARDAANLVFWVEAFGVGTGDRSRLTVTAPNGRVIADSTTEPSTQHWASRMVYAGLRRTDPQWMAGVYRGVYVLERMVGGAWTPVFTVNRQVEVR